MTAGERLAALGMGALLTPVAAALALVEVAARRGRDGLRRGTACLTPAGGPLTGERVSSPAGGFNPTWQRHVAAYRACASLLPPDASSTSAAGPAIRSAARAARVGRRRHRRRRAGRPGARDARGRHAVAAVRRRLVRLGALGAVDRARSRSGACACGVRARGGAGGNGGVRDAQPPDLRAPRRDHRPLPLRRVRPAGGSRRCAGRASRRSSCAGCSAPSATALWSRASSGSSTACSRSTRCACGA